jgi:hypothetical protein
MRLAFALLLFGCSSPDRNGGSDGASGGGSDGGSGSESTLYVGLEDLFERGISRTCSLNNGVCHNSKEYPSLDSIPALLDTLNAPCAIGALDARLVPNECEPAGDHLVSAALGLDAIIARVDVGPAAAATDQLTLATLHLAAPAPAASASDLVIRRDAVDFAVGSARLAADGTVTVDLSSAAIELKRYFDTRVFPLGESMIHVADTNGDGVLGHALGWSLARPRDPDRSYLIGRLTQTRLGELMPRQCRTWDANASRALYCWLRGLDENDPLAPIDYRGCELPAGSAQKCELAIPDGGLGTFAAVEAVLARDCASAGCHAGAQPAGALDLSAAQAYANLVGVPSSEAPSRTRVVPGDPSSSWLECKLDPACADRVGAQMPLGGALGPGELDVIESWIRDGANP